MIPEEGTDKQLKDVVYNAMKPAADQMELWLFSPVACAIPSVFKTHSHDGTLVVVETRHCVEPYHMTLASFIESVLSGSIRLAPHGTRFIKHRLPIQCSSNIMEL